jgi:hypothetical protein
MVEGCYCALIARVRADERESIAGRATVAALKTMRCVHGDEINHANGARVMCLGCQRYLPDHPMLYVCTVTGEVHGG